MNASEKMESTSYKIELCDLQKITDMLFRHIINTRNQKEIDIEKIYYWDIPFDELFDVNKEPLHIDIGSIKEDWEFLSEILKDEDLLLASQFTKLSAIFRYLGEQLSKKLATQGG